MFFNPEKARTVIGKAGSTFAINYGELLIRLLLGISFVITSKTNIYEQYFTIFGYFFNHFCSNFDAYTNENASQIFNKSS